MLPNKVNQKQMEVIMPAAITESSGDFRRLGRQFLRKVADNPAEYYHVRRSHEMIGLYSPDYFTAD